MRFFQLALTFTLLTADLFSQTKILFIGDSITEGHENVDKDCPGYVALTRNCLLEKGYDVTILNYGKAGIPSLTCRHILKNALKQDRPDIVVINCGIVDAIYNYNPLGTMTNIHDMIKLALKKKIKVIVGRINISSWKHSTTADYIARFNSVYENLEKTFPIQTFSFLDDSTLGSLKYNTGDLVHPNSRGELRIKERLWKPLTKVLDKL